MTTPPLRYLPIAMDCKNARKEIELKLEVTPAVAGRLVRAKHFKRLRVGKARKRRLVSTYFDTPRHVLRKSGIALRVRDDGEKRAQTVKAAASGVPGLRHRTEWTVPLIGDRPELDQLLQTGLAPGLAQRRDVELRPVFTADLERTTLRLRTGRAEVELAIDQGVIRTGENGVARDEPVCEVEFELLSGQTSELLRLALAVCENFDARPAHLTKSERGYALARAALRPRPVKASAVSLDPQMTVGAAFNVVVGGALEHLLGNQAPTLEGHPDGIHQTRVAMRRLRAALRAFKRVLPYHERKAFNAEFRWFQQRLAPARDWHVFLTETLPQLAGMEAASPRQLELLRRIARDERRRATGAAVAHLKSRRYARLILRFERWIGDVGTDRKSPALGRPIAPFAKRVLKKSRRELLAESRSLRHLSRAELHELRKRGKKARYAAEFFATLTRGGTTVPYLERLEQLQDHLGQANDAAVACHLLLTVRPGRLAPELVRNVETWSQQRALECIEEAQPFWRRLRKCGHMAASPSSGA